MVVFGLIGGLIGGLGSGLASGLVFGLIGGWFGGIKYGGAAYIQHFILRQMLHQKGRIPWNYAKFLDFASEHLLMKKIGGGYVFFHRMLLEHFAQMDRSRVPVSESTSQTNVNSSSAGNVINTTPQPSNPVQNRIVCSNCSHNNSTDSKFCTKCGRQLIKHP